MSHKTMSRRKFLTLAGAGLGTGMLTCCGLGWLLTSQEPLETSLPICFPDIALGGVELKKKILVAYASANGSTGGIAETIGKAFYEQGVAADIRPVNSVTDFSGYNAVVIGSAINGGKWLPEATEFVTINQEKLSQLPVAYFLVGMMAGSDSESNRELVANFLEAERTLVEPAAEGRFAGAMFVNKLSFFEKLGMLFFLTYCGLGLQGGDYRDAEAVRAWSTEVFPLLIN
jgi:menaquinone-dependent protoporphyrinogen oxidase